MPRAAAVSAVFPESATEGAPLVLRKTAISWNSVPWPKPAPIAFITASLAAKRAAKCSAGRGCARQ
jgi:hypothetical protein